MLQSITDQGQTRVHACLGRLERFKKVRNEVCFTEGQRQSFVSNIISCYFIQKLLNLPNLIQSGFENLSIATNEHAT